MSLQPRFTASLRALGPFEPHPHFAVAVSGGSDSMALTLLAHHATQADGGRITTLTVDHGLRPESGAEAAQVAQWMHARGIAHHVLTPPHRSVSNNRMEAARTWRYDALSGWCREHHVLHCLLGHHADDQDETIALHRARGTTEDGSSGMRHCRHYRGVRFLRPLLALRKTDLQAYLRAQGVAWIEDPTNRDPRFARARLRAGPVPCDVGDADARQAREWHAAHAAACCIRMEPEGTASITLGVWRALPTPLATQLLADLIRTLGGGTTRPRKRQTLLLAQALMQVSPTSRTLGGCRIVSDGTTAYLALESGVSHRPFAPPKPLAASPFW